MTFFLLLTACTTTDVFGSDYAVAETGPYDIEDGAFAFSLYPAESTVALSLVFTTSEMSDWTSVEFINSDLDGNGMFNLHIEDAPDTAWIVFSGVGHTPDGYSNSLCVAKNVNPVIFPAGYVDAAVGEDDVIWNVTYQQKDYESPCYMFFSWSEESGSIELPIFE